MDKGYTLQVIANENTFELSQIASNKKISQDDQMIIHDLWEDYINNPNKTIYELGFIKKYKWFTPSLEYLIEIVSMFINEIRQTPQLEELKGCLDIELDDLIIDQLILRKPYMLGDQYINEKYLRSFFHIIINQYNLETKDYDKPLDDYFNERLHKEPVGRVFFHLVENANGKLPFAFLATYSQILDNHKIKQIPLIKALDQYRNDNETLVKLLSTVDKASKQSPFINDLIQSGELMHPLAFTAKEAYTFLQEIPIYEECGIVCRIPRWFKQKSNSLSVNVTVGEKAKSFVGMDSLINFDVNITVNGEILTQEELQQIIEENDGLLMIKGKWVEINHEELQKILDKYQEIQDELADGLTLKEALNMQLQQASDNSYVSFTNGQWLQDTFKELYQPTINPDIDVHVNATLREYQKTGISWLSYMQSLGFGACLADDMGLGKTLQVLAMLSQDYNKNKKTLLIVPASLLSNWENEIKKFVPQLSYKILHPSNKKKDLDIEGYQLIITTYSMVSKYDVLTQNKWDIEILDEAQNIKNPRTKQTKAVKSINSSFKLALTGTPIENNLMDLWSLFDYLNSGLLGNEKEFKTFVKNISKNNGGYQKLRNMTQPFILRRLKTDKSIISDLPDKIEMKTYTQLSKKQLALYQDLVDDLKDKLIESEGINRKGLVLASLLKFKQICNHPDEYLGQNVFDEKESGKFLRLKEICEEIYEKHERVLVFTQFKEMVQPLSDYLETIFHTSGVTLDGSTTVKKRQEAVDKFQSEQYVPYMVLSIKAGGVGLNLTKASHVIHFDRWWNPAVENQATDRAFRIGQTKNVVVHKFISEGTIEEKIDTLIESKIQLSDDIIAEQQETWITEMSNEELLDLFNLEGGF
ncbi:MAG: DEAD/DEAH box helicase [Erysipelotrichaceae bacterium]|nr:DEAD/DEAH box helicase [Erysipelotrichaceae bacterium]